MALKLSITFPNGSVADYHKISRIEGNPKHGLTVYVQHYKDATYREANAPCVSEEVENFAWDTWKAFFDGSLSGGAYGLLKTRDKYKEATDIADVTLDKTSLALKVGESATLIAIVQPDEPVTWASSDETVATVIGGKVEAIKTGTVEIYATVGDSRAICIAVVA
jgi:hypothetical protein